MSNRRMTNRQAKGLVTGYTGSRGPAEPVTPAAEGLQNRLRRQLMAAGPRMTRRQAKAWLAPMRSCLQSIRDTGDADTLRGYPVTRLHDGDDYARIDACIAGFLGLIDRVCPQIDTSALHRIEMRLAAGTPLTVDLLDDAMRVFRAVEDALLRLYVADVKEAVWVEQVAIELDEIREAA